MFFNRRSHDLSWKQTIQKWTNEEPHLGDKKKPSGLEERLYIILKRVSIISMHNKIVI